MTTYVVSERRACRLIGLSRSTKRYRICRPERDGEVQQRLTELARQRPRYGYRRLHAVLRQEGMVVNHKRVYRLYREARLSLRRRHRRRWERIGPGPGAAPTRPNERSSMGFVSDSLGNGQSLRVLTVVDDYTRECVAIEVGTSLSALRVCRVLEAAVGQRGRPESIVCHATRPGMSGDLA